MANEIVVAEPPNGEVPVPMEKVLVQGDLRGLTPAQRLSYYLSLCKSLNLNPATRPFEYLELKGPGGTKLVLYARKDCTEQLGRVHGLSVVVTEKDYDWDHAIYTVWVEASDKTGRKVQSCGCCSLSVRKRITKKVEKGGKTVDIDSTEDVPAQGDDLANIVMKTETKARRRVTLAICGLGFMDETEIETVKSASAPKPALAHQREEIVRLAFDAGWIKGTEAIPIDRLKPYDALSLDEINQNQADHLISTLRSLVS